MVFILLVFFMLASRFADWRPVTISAGQAGGGGTGVEGALLLEIRADGLRLSGAPVTAEALAARLGARLAARPDQLVLVQPGPGVALQPTLDALDLLAEAGVRRTRLIEGAAR
ncbi:hypothetical protein LNKW23_27430 [Paralimibaculum aggregatum]|uniref:Biopolymer transporter ExbD n=1 Tax=Paralimibaculum aggregatum TaxID=3036245 RepID=A0ABQ6LRA7_9RHOB|nr:hypothetical protein LNKW23_27430 [Limibaculum sp. NKW23]